MFQHRAPLVLTAASGGLAGAALLWLVFGTHPGAWDRIDGLNARLAALAQAAAPAEKADDLALSRALGAPLFVLTSGQGAVAEVSLHLSGLAMVGPRKAALIAINDQPAVWLDLGATKNGVTVMAVEPSRVTVDTPTGFRTIGLADAKPQDPTTDTTAAK